MYIMNEKIIVMEFSNNFILYVYFSLISLLKSVTCVGYSDQKLHENLNYVPLVLPHHLPTSVRDFGMTDSNLWRVVKGSLHWILCNKLTKSRDNGVDNLLVAKRVILLIYSLTFIKGILLHSVYRVYVIPLINNYNTL